MFEGFSCLNSKTIDPVVYGNTIIFGSMTSQTYVVEVKDYVTTIYKHFNKKLHDLTYGRPFRNLKYIKNHFLLKRNLLPFNFDSSRAISSSASSSGWSDSRCVSSRSRGSRGFEGLEWDEFDEATVEIINNVLNCKTLN